MIDPTTATTGPAPAPTSALRRLALAAVCRPAELVVSTRGLVVLFFLVAGLIATAGWLRPALSPDLGLLHLPLRWGSGGPSPEELLYGPRRPRVASLGGLLLVLIALAAALALLRPRRFGTAAGLLLAGALVANAAAACNYPALIELMDLEYEQRKAIATFQVQSQEHTNVTYDRQGRVTVLGQPGEDTQKGDLSRGLAYLLYGRWLPLWALTGVLLGSRGPLRRRLLRLAGWAALGLGLAAVACLPRLRAEVHWARAKYLEGRRADGEARAALEQAVAVLPELRRLERTWLLTGKLDDARGVPSPQAELFRAYQFARGKRQPRVSTSQQDLAWLVATTQNDRQRRQASALLAGLLARGFGDEPAVRHQAARVWTAVGLAYHRQPLVYTDAGVSTSDQDRELNAARAQWQRAAAVDPSRRDAAFYLGMLRTRLDRDFPDRTEDDFRPALDRLDDCILRADILAAIGRAYARAGRADQARRWYAASCEAFSLPKIANHLGLKGMGGL